MMLIGVQPRAMTPSRFIVSNAINEVRGLLTEAIVGAANGLFRASEKTEVRTAT